MRTRKTYHSSIKLAYALGLQDTWLPRSFTETIPRSTYHAWKTQAKEKYVGYQFAHQINSNVEELKMTYHQRLERERQLFMAYARIKLTLINVIIGRERFEGLIKEHFKDIVHTIESSKNSFHGGVKEACSHLNIKPRLYYYWRSISKHHCTVSPKNICVKKVPNQATLQEFKIMKSLLSRKRFEHWPICSVWGYAKRKGHTNLSLASWYHYNREFSFRKKYKKGTYKKSYSTIRAPHPNHTWHADVTQYTTLDGVRHYIYFIVDNYSRYFVNWKVDASCNAQMRTQSLKEALEQEFPSNHEDSDLSLIVDGGTENNNRKIHEFIRQANVNIDKKVALRDIKESNTMVEASIKTVKYSYLFRAPIHNRKELEEHLSQAIHDHCYVRPHHALDSFTPSEVHKNQRPVIHTPTKKEIIHNRCRFNMSQECSQNCCSKE
jgi:transposase InsO family protein